MSTDASRLSAVRDGAAAVGGAVLGVLPHLMHHIGLIAGTAFVAGFGGNALFYALGLAFSIPMLRRIRRRFGNWAAPAVAVGVFTALFALSASVLGPALSGDGERIDRPSVPTPSPTGGHSEHHT